jgi:hypothetical protein
VAVPDPVQARVSDPLTGPMPGAVSDPGPDALRQS